MLQKLACATNSSRHHEAKIRHRPRYQCSHGAQDVVDAAEGPVQLRPHRGLQEAQAAGTAAVIIREGQHEGVVALKQLLLVVCNLQRAIGDVHEY